jgi:hypothetical protein
MTLTRSSAERRNGPQRINVVHSDSLMGDELERTYSSSKEVAQQFPVIIIIKIMMIVIMNTAIAIEA